MSAREGPTVAARMIAANKANVSFLSLSSASFENSKKIMIFCQASVALVAVKTLLVAKRRRHVDLNIFAAARA